MLTEPQAQSIRSELIDAPEDPHRATIDPALIGELADDIAANGLINPPALRGPSPAGRYEVIAGHRRYLALRLLRWTHIPGRVWPWATEPIDIRTAENLQRVDLNPIEEARIARRYADAGQPVAAIARLMRRSRPWVESRLALLEAPEDVRGAVERGELGIAVAAALSTIGHDDYRRALVDEARRTGATLPTVQVWLAHYAADGARLVQNHATVEEIVRRRDSYVLYVPCDGCRTDTPYATTRALRLCPDCYRAIAEAARQEAGSSPQA